MIMSIGKLELTLRGNEILILVFIDILLVAEETEVVGQ